MHVMHVVGARPNFMKAAPLMTALAGDPNLRQTLVHTGQHYDSAMSGVFFQQLGMPAPDINLEVGSGRDGQQIAAIMSAFEGAALRLKPDLVVVYGDVNSTLAAAIVSAKLKIKVAHVEAGLRSFDRTMPEEINRIVTDQISDILFTPSEDADRNLANEGIDPGRVHLVGNVMIDTLVRMLPRIKDHVPEGIPSEYVLVTLHRPSNVDDLPWLKKMLKMLSDFGHTLPVVFPVHPRTRKNVFNVGFQCNNGMRLMDPVPYLEFLALQKNARAVITDSGGVQEESTFLGVPCLTVRENTERPVTIHMGTNRLVGRDVDHVRTALDNAIAEGAAQQTVPPLWDGQASRRIAGIISESIAKLLVCA